MRILMTQRFRIKICVTYRAGTNQNVTPVVVASTADHIVKVFLTDNSFPTKVDIRQSLYLPTDAHDSCFKRILKFTLKQRLHVSVQSPSSGSVLFELAKVVVVKIIY
jgi:hypothetical protein